MKLDEKLKHCKDREKEAKKNLVNCLSVHETALDEEAGENAIQQLLDQKRQARLEREEVEKEIKKQGLSNGNPKQTN